MSTAILKEQLAEAELAEAESALQSAEAAHAAIFAQCAEQQQAVEDLERRVQEAQHAFYSADRRRGGAKAGILNHRSNPPQNKFAVSEIDEYRRRFGDLERELAAGETEYAQASATVMRLQSERHAAKATLADLAFKERQAAGVLAGARERVAELTPPAPINATDAHMPQLDGVTLVYSSGGVRSVNPQTRRAASRGKADKVTP